jgi:hypothetical protein
MNNIKTLFFAASPVGTSGLMVEEEIRAITKKIRAADYRDSIELVPALAARPDDLIEMLNQHKPQIVHFSAHGKPTGEILLLDKVGGLPKAVKSHAIRELFKTMKDNIRVVLLNACYSKVQARAIVKVIDCAIGINIPITNQAAIAFAASFYGALGFGRSVKDAYEQGRAAILLEGVDKKNIPELLVKDGVDPSCIFLWTKKEKKGTGKNVTEGGSMIIHILTGSKGGIGKTRCSISHVMYYLLGGTEKPLLNNKSRNNQKKYGINIFDANSNNIDFFTIMTGEDFEILADERKKQVSDFNKNYIRQKLLDITYKGKKLPINGFAYIRKSPFELFNGISDFWNSLYEVAKSTKENDGNDILVVDTNLAVPNLISETPEQIEKMKTVFQKLRELRVKNILIWYIWCLNDFLSIRENLTFNTSRQIRMLEKICKGDQNLGGNGHIINQYVIHVLNPYLFFDRSPIFKSFLVKLIANPVFKNIMEKMGNGFQLPFDMAVKILVEIINGIIDEKGGLSFSWEEAVKKINDTGVNIVVLKNENKNRSYIKEQLVNISSKKIISYQMIHRNCFGEDTLWKKLKEFHRYITGEK